MKKSICYFILSMTGFLVQTGETSKSLNKQKSILPENLIPEHYTVVIYLQMGTDWSKLLGDVSIMIECAVATNQIILNSKNLNIDEGKVRIKSVLDNGSPVTDQLHHQYLIEYDQYIITLLDRQLEAGQKYIVNIPFEADSQHESIDYNVYNYVTNLKQIERRIVFSKFDEVGTAGVFPCFNQLNLKAKFQLYLAYREHVTGFSSLESVYQQRLYHTDGWTVQQFGESPIPMSTFSFAFATANFDSVVITDNHTSEQILIWADTEIISHLEIFGRTALKVYQFYSHLFNVPYGLPKLDILVLPNLPEDDEKANYGLIFFGKSVALSSNKFEEFVKISKLCKVISYQWIGGYVTMSKWNEYWLHEGMSLFFQTSCHQGILQNSINIYSNINMVETFIDVLVEDVKVTSSPVFIQDENQYDLIDEHAETAAFKKAYHLFRMINFFLGKTLLESNVTNYLNEFKYGNSKVSDVWNVLGMMAPSVFTLEMIMQSWINNKGYPLVTVTRSYYNGENSIIIKQEPFVVLEEENDAQNRNTCWTIPLSYTTKRDLKFDNVGVTHWLTCNDSLQLTIDAYKEQWILFNLQLNVPCRTTYDDRNWILIQKTLLNPNEYLEIDELTRVRLISDMFAISEAGRLSYEIVFNTIIYLAHEESYLVWKVALDQLDKIRSRLIRMGILVNAFQKYIKQFILQPLFEKLTFKNTGKIITKNQSQTDMLFSILIVQSSCKFGIRSCQKKCHELVEAWNLNRKNLIPRSIQETIYCSGVKLGNERTWNFLWEKYARQSKPNERNEILRALACSKNKEILQRYLNWSMVFPDVSKSERLLIFSSLSSNELGYPLMREFFNSRLDDIIASHEDDETFAGLYFAKLLESTSKRRDYNELIGLKNSLGEKINISTKLFLESISTAKRNVIWLERNKTALRNLFF